MLGRLKRNPTFRYSLVVVLLVGVSAGSVFAGTRLNDEAAPAPEPAEQVRADGTLAGDPKPLMLDEIDDAPGGSAARAVMRLWFWAQWGSLPNVVAAYDPEVVERVGSEDIASTYTLNRSTYISSRPRIVDVSTGRRGTVVHVEALRRNAPPQRSSFTLRRRDGYWYVVFDTVLEQGLAAWVQFRSMPDPDAKDIPAAAVRAGINAARRYRLVGTEASNPRPALTPRVEPNS